MARSSAKRWHIRLLKKDGRKWIWSRKRVAAKTEPWGAPTEISIDLETASPKWIDIVLSFNHEAVHLSKGNGKSSSTSVEISAECHILSKVDMKSTKTTSAGLLFAAVVSLRSSTIDKIRIWRRLSAVKPDCSSMNIPFSMHYFSIRTWIILSKILSMFDRSEIGLSLFTSGYTPSFDKHTTLACLLVWRTLPSWATLLKAVVKICRYSVDNLCNRNADKPSESVDFFSALCSS